MRLMKEIELNRFRGYPVNSNEEAFRSKLQNIQKQLNLPNQYKGRLNELVSVVRMQEELPVGMCLFDFKKKTKTYITKHE